MRIFALALLASTVMVSPAVAQQIGKPAPVSSLVKQVNIPHEQFTLANGLRVIVHTDRKAPVVAVSVWYDVGSKHEPKGKTGFAHLFEHLMFNGSENADGDFFTPLQNMGATDFNGTTWFDRTNYFETVPKGALERALFLESDRMGHLLGAVTQDKLSNQIGVVQNEKRQGDNQPYGLVEYAQLKGTVPADHPYGHSTIGSMADLDAASLEDVKNWFRAHYGPNNAVLVLAGDIDAKAAKPLVEKWFGDIPAGPRQARLTVAVPTLDAPRSEVMKDNVATTRHYRYWAVPGIDSTDAVPLKVAATVLGGLASSRLDNALVRGEKLAVAVTASYQDFAQLGWVEVTADVRPGVDSALVAKRLDEILADFIKTGPTADEVRRVATRAVAERIDGLEQVGGFGGKAVALAEGELYRDDADAYKKDLVALSKVKPAEVTKAMQKWLTRPVYALTVVPGEREAYQESGSVKPGGATQAPSYYRAPQAGEQPLAPPARVGAEEMQAGASGPLAAADRSKLPDVGAIADLDFPTVERAKLSNGVPIVYVQRNAVPMTQVSVSFDAGNAADPRDRLGTQSFMLSLLDEGAAGMTSVQIAEAQERLGATIGSGASMDRTTVNLSALSANLDPSLALLADVVLKPDFAPAEVERLRSQQLARIQSELKAPQSIALRTLPPLLFGNQHPYGVSFTGTGDAATVASVTRDELVGFHHKWLRPEKATIFVVSDQPLAKIVKTLDAKFGKWPVTGAAGTKAEGGPVPAAQPRIVLVDRPDSPQSYILAGQVLPKKGTDDIETLITANQAVGAGFLSRINMDLRETRGWSYGVRGSINRVAGDVPYIVYAPVQADRTGESIAALRADYKEFLTSKGVTDEERTRIVNGNVLELPGSYETSDAVLGAIQRNALYKRSDDFYDSLASRYRGMTRGQLDAAIRAVLNPDQFLWVVVGDAKIVRPQLEKLGLPIEQLSATAGK